MLKSILVSIHGVRDQKERRGDRIKNVSEVAFGLTPSNDIYECP